MSDMRLTEEQYAAIVNAGGEGLLAEVMDEWRARQRWKEAGNMLLPSDLTDDVKRTLIPHFAAVIADLVVKGWINLWTGLPGADGVAIVPSDQIEAVLADPASWIRKPDGFDRMVGMTTTELWARSFRNG